MTEKIIKQSKSWRLTDWDLSEKRIQFYKDLDKSRMALGKETCPETGRKHLQIFITFKRSYTFNPLKKLLGKDVHIIACKVEDWNYELKDMDYILQGSNQGQRTDLDKIKKISRVAEIVDEVNYQGIRHAELYLKYKEQKRNFMPEIYWLSGPTGCGKSKYVYDREEDPFVPINFKWWEGYDAHEAVILDDYRRDFCKFHELLKLLDRYPYRVETKGGSRQLLAKRIYITTPYTIDETFSGRTHEDINQLKRRITKEFRFDASRTMTEVGKGNTSSQLSADEDIVEF